MLVGFLLRRSKPDSFFVRCIGGSLTLSTHSPSHEFNIAISKRCSTKHCAF